MAELTNRQREVLAAVPDQVGRGSDWIAGDLHEETHWIASPLKALERKGFITCTKRGGFGIASLWRRTDAGRLALKNQESDRG